MWIDLDYCYNCGKRNVPMVRRWCDACRAEIAKEDASERDAIQWESTQPLRDGTPGEGSDPPL